VFGLFISFCQNLSTDLFIFKKQKLAKSEGKHNFLLFKSEKRIIVGVEDTRHFEFKFE